jgi:hypothetical protein
MKTQLVELVMQCVREVADFEGRTLSCPVGPETPLFGAEGILDSMGLVNVVILAEQYISDQHGASITLADRRALSQSRSPFRTVDSLAAYAEILLKEWA